MRFRSCQPLRSKAVLTLLGTFLILTVSAASDAGASGTWSPTGSMTVPRFSPTATLLTDGRVLVAGGCGAFDNFGDCLILTVLASAELYNPATGTWSATGSTSVGSFGFVATRLLDGRVLVAGGGPNGTSAELYNPATGTWSPTGSTSSFFFVATLLLDGRVLVTGGGSNGTSAELYNPTTGTWSPTGNTSVGRFGFAATRLLDGRVLVTGGGPNGTSAELYDPTTGTWSPTGSTSGGFFGAATLLQDGMVLV